MSAPTQQTASGGETQQLRYVDYLGYIKWPSEQPSLYGPGGFHPIILGDHLGDHNRFRVVHKLGDGGQATVWLCRDTQTEKWRAVKVFASYITEAECPDLAAYAQFSDITPETLLEEHHIALPLEHFWITGPNGRHFCLVLQLLVPSLRDLHSDWQELGRVSLDTPHDIDPDKPLEDVDSKEVRDLQARTKRICWQLADAMAFMHSHGVCHGDFRPPNILFQTDRSIDDASEAELMSLLGSPVVIPVYVDEGGRNDGDRDDDDDDDYDSDDDDDSYYPFNNPAQKDNEPDTDASENQPQDDIQALGFRAFRGDARHFDPGLGPTVPKYLVQSVHLPYNCRWRVDEIAVVDFGVSYLTSKPPRDAETGIEFSYSAPEGLYKTGYLTTAADVWSLASTMIFAMANKGPFQHHVGHPIGVPTFRLELALGPLPECYEAGFKARRTGRLYRRTELGYIEATAGKTAKSVAAKGPWGMRHGVMRNLQIAAQEIIDVYKPEGDRDHRTPGGYKARKPEKRYRVLVAPKDAKELADIGEKVFTWMPADRISAADVLGHPWLAEMKPAGRGADKRKADDEPEGAQQLRLKRAVTAGFEVMDRTSNLAERRTTSAGWRPGERDSTCSWKGKRAVKTARTTGAAWKPVGGNSASTVPASSAETVSAPQKQANTKTGEAGPLKVIPSTASSGTAKTQPSPQQHQHMRAVPQDSRRQRLWSRQQLLNMPKKLLTAWVSLSRRR